MDLLDKLINIARTSTLEELPHGYAKDLETFWEEFIEPRLPSVDTVRKWHEILMRYIEDEDVVFILRTFGQYENKKKESESLRRGFLNRTDKKISVVYVDNFITAYFCSMALDGYVPTYEEMKSAFQTRRFPIGYRQSTAEKKKCAYYTGKDPQIQKKGYKIAHVYDAGQKFSNNEGIDRIKKFCDLFFPRGKYADWNIVEDKEGKPYQYRNVYIDEKSFPKVRSFLVAHFIRTVHPINYFLVPKRMMIRYLGSKNEIGEYEPLIDYVRSKFKDRYGVIYDEFLSLIQPEKEPCLLSSNIQINAEYGPDLDIDDETSDGANESAHAEEGGCEQEEDDIEEINKKKIGQYAYDIFSDYLINDNPSSSVIENLKNKQYCKKMFGINYPVLVNICDDFDKHRYYVKPIIGKYYISSQWFESYRPKLERWLQSEIYDSCAVVEAKVLSKEIDKYRNGKTNRSMVRLTNIQFENEYIKLVRVDTSNKWVGPDMVKMWSLTFEQKKDVSSLQRYRELAILQDTAITKVNRGQDKGCSSIRFYDMRTNPSDDIVNKILDYIFG